MTDEQTLKTQICEWLSARPNCMYRVIQIGRIPGRTNQSKGVSDIIGCINGRAFFIEVKSKSGTLRPEQEKFLMDASRAGAITIVARDFETVVKEISA